MRRDNERVMVLSVSVTISCIFHMSFVSQFTDNEIDLFMTFVNNCLL